MSEIIHSSKVILLIIEKKLDCGSTLEVNGCYFVIIAYINGTY